jgi:hypothetical protein
MPKPKKNQNEGLPSKPTVAATIDELVFLQSLVTKLASKPFDLGRRKQKTLAEWQAMDTSSLEAYVSGHLSFENGNEKADMPFTTAFLFTCTQLNKEGYDLSWVSSLS